MEPGKDLSKERVGRYRDRETGQHICIRETKVGTYEKVYLETGSVVDICPLGTIVSEKDINGLEKLSE
jgi:hypothetical protein